MITKRPPLRINTLLVLAALLTQAALSAHAADRFWSGGTASYNNPANWTGGIVPGATDNAINDNGINNVVQINGGDPDWTLSQLRAGSSAGNGAFEQNGQTLRLSNAPRALRLGVASGRLGVYTLNGGAINHTNGSITIGELGQGTLNIDGGSISGNGNLVVNVGSSLDGVNATMDGGTNKTEYTWFEQGFYLADPSRGLPAAGSTFASESQPDHSYTMASSYAANSVVMIDTNVPSAAITLTSPTACSALSFLGSAGRGPVTVNYTVHHADTTTESGTLIVPDWFADGAMVAWRAGGRVQANGLTYQIINDGPNKPYLLSMDIAVASPGPVTSIDLTYVSGGTACLLAVSAYDGVTSTPLAITGYNADMILGAGEPIFVSSAVTDTLDQTAGTINITGELWVGNYGAGIYNLSGGTNTFQNWFALGRSGGSGTLNMTGGELNKTGNGNLLIGTGFQAPFGSAPAGVVNHSGGTITCQGEFLCPENSPGTGTYNLSGTAVLNANSWLAIGRNGGSGFLNMSGGAITKAGGGNIVIGGGGEGTLTQSGGTITNTSSQTWVAEGSIGTWNLNGGSARLGVVHIAQNASSLGTLNLNGGILSASQITSGNVIGFSTLNLNGGTIQATADNPNFLHSLSVAQIDAGGALFDSQGFNIGVAQSLSGGGGLTKLGAGTLTLSGANSYAGPTAVNAGKLVMTTDSYGGGDFTVADGAGMGVQVQAANAQFNAANVTLAGSTAASLDFDLGAFGNPTSAPLNVPGTFAVNGTITVNIADALPQEGLFPLVQYGTRTGAGSFVLGTLPVGIGATILTNGNSIALDIASVNLPRWDGQAGGDWDLGLTANWVNIGTALPTYYGEGNFVLFDDNALGTTTVNLVATVNPGSLTANNSSLGYTLTGSGKISGPTGFTKQGAGTFAIVNTGGNNYTGPTVISGGVLSVTHLANGGSPSAIGASSANPTNLVLANAALRYSGPPVTANRGFAVAHTNSAIDAQSDFALSGQVTALPNPGIGSGFVKTGPAQLALTTVGANEFANAYSPGLRVDMGTMLFDGSAGIQTNHTVNEMWVGGTPDSGASLILSNTTLRVDSWLGLGRGNGTIGNVSAMTLHNSRFYVGNMSCGYANNIVGNLAAQFMTLNNSAITNNGAFHLGESGGSTATLTVNGSSTITNRGDVNFARDSGSAATVNINGTSVFGSNNRIQVGGAGATGAVVIANSGQMLVGNAWFSIGNGNAGNGSVLLKNNGSLWVSGDFNVTDTGTSIGALTLQDNAVVSVGNVWFGKAGGTLATVNMSGGTFTVRGNSQHLRVANDPGSSCTVNLSGGTIAVGSELRVGQSGTATWNQTGGAVWSTNWTAIGRGAGGVGIYNISGGSLTMLNPGARMIVGVANSGTLNISGTAQVASRGAFQLGETTGNGTVNLNGGTLTVPRVFGGTGVGTFNFNGGTLVAANAADPNFLSGLTSANVLSGGATIDSGTSLINIAQPLLDGSGSGGLTKLGSGTLNLNGANTYTGATLVNAGTLGGSGSLSGPVTVAATATLAPGTSIGTLTVNNSVTLAGTNVMEISKDGGLATSDLLAVSGNLAFGGTLTVVLTGTNALAFNDTFNLFDWGTQSGSFAPMNLPAGYYWDTSQLYVDGTIRVIGIVPPTVNPPTVVGGNLVLTGVGGPPGASYTWLTATNLAASPILWTTNSTGIFDSAGAFSNALPVNVSEPARFFRLQTP